MSCVFNFIYFAPSLLFTPVHDPGVILASMGNILHSQDIGTYTAYVDTIRGTWWNAAKFPTGVKTFDVILVDGRMRVACALNAVPFLTECETCVIVMHDFQRFYNNKFVMKYFNVIDQSKPFETNENVGRPLPQLGVLQLKKEMVKVSVKDMDGSQIRQNVE